MKKLILVFVFLLLVVTLSVVEGFAQQDAQYSQYMFNRLAINPAFAGNRDVFSSSLVYRNQWTAIGDNPTTAALSLQTPLKNKKAGVGLEIVTDKLGLRKTSAALLSYAYRIQFLKGKLAFGLRSGIYNYVFDWSKIKVKDETDVYNTGISSSKMTGTADFGMYYYTLDFYCGLGFTHLNKGRVNDLDLADSSAKQSVHFFMPVGKSFLVGKTVFNPSVLLKKSGHSPMEIDLNFNALLKERFWVGMSLRLNYGIVVMTQYLVTDKLKIGYSYDLGMNAIGRTGRSTHEIMLGYDLNFKGAKVETLRYF